MPAKSACFFCPATKKPELLQLQIRHPALVRRAIAIEQRAKPNLRSVKGLGRNFAWTDWLNERDGRVPDSALTAQQGFAASIQS